MTMRTGFSGGPGIFGNWFKNPNRQIDESRSCLLHRLDEQTSRDGPKWLCYFNSSWKDVFPSPLKLLFLEMWVPIATLCSMVLTKHSKCFWVHCIFMNNTRKLCHQVKYSSNTTNHRTRMLRHRPEDMQAVISNDHDQKFDPVRYIAFWPSYHETNRIVAAVTQS